MELLDVDVRQEADWTVVVVGGQLDVATAPRFRQALLEAQYGGANRVVIDLGGVEFLDSMGLGVIVGALKRARAHDGEVVLAGANERITHVLTLSRVAEIVRLADGVDEVLATS